MKNLYCFLILLSSLQLFSQKEANIWYFGNNAGVDFNTSPPTALTDGQVSTEEGCSSFSDTNGNLLFYSDGINVYNKNHALMTYTNGDLANNLEGNPSSTQSGMIIPKPNSNSIYYLFTVGTDFTPDGIEDNPGFNYYTIDISLNNGLGQITNGPINLAINPSTNEDLSLLWSEKVTAVKGKECNTFWILSFVVDTFYAYKVNENGVDLATIITSKVNFTLKDKRGYLQVSPDGKKIALADYNLINFTNGSSFINGSLNLFNFDDLTGVVNPIPQTLIDENTNQSPYGVAFSQQSNKLYTSTFNNQAFSILQFDLESTDIKASEKTIITKGDSRVGLQLAPDGKIYVSLRRQAFLDAIENPDKDADEVIYSEEAIDLNGRFATQGLPPFIASLLSPLDITETSSNKIITNENLQYCIGESISFKTNNEAITGNNINYTWTFNNGITSTIITNPSFPSTLEISNISSINNGTYTLNIDLKDECDKQISFEGSFNIEVFAPAKANKPNDITICKTNSFYSINLQEIISPQIINQQNSSLFEVLFFSNETDANQNTNSLPNNYEINQFGTQKIYPRIHNINAPEACFDFTSFNLTLSAEPQPTQPLNYIACDDSINGNDTDGFFNNFILNTKDAEILGNLDPNQFNISYHTSLVGANTSSTTDLINKNTPYRNTSINEQKIYVRIENKDNLNCFISSEENSTSFAPFFLIINPLPVINTPTQLTQCNDNTTTNINLTLAEMNISSNYTNEIFKYYPTENNAITNTLEITNTNSYTINNSNSVWVKVISSEGCYRISELNLIFSSNSVIPYNETLMACDDEMDSNGNDSDNDGITFFDFSVANESILNNFSLTAQENLDVLFFETINDRNIIENNITNTSQYRNINIPALTAQDLYFKVINKTNNNCEGIGQFLIKTNPLPSFNITTPQIVCLDNTPLTLRTENSLETYSYQWIKDNIIIGTEVNLDISSGGVYYITATNNTTTCSSTKSITVIESSIPTISINDITIIEENNSNNSITINPSNLGAGNYEYSLVNEDQTETIRNYQDNPFFENLEGGIYTIIVQDKKSCGIATLQVSIIEFPKFLTPNNDGENDFWIIKGANTTFFPNSFIYIFDRFGKQLAEIPIDSDGWNGTFNGKQLPPNDYWYSVQLTDLNGNTRSKKGHFSLIRN